MSNFLQLLYFLKFCATAEYNQLQINFVKKSRNISNVPQVKPIKRSWMLILVFKVTIIDDDVGKNWRECFKTFIRLFCEPIWKTAVTGAGVSQSVKSELSEK